MGQRHSGHTMVYDDYTRRGYRGSAGVYMNNVGPESSDTSESRGGAATSPSPETVEVTPYPTQQYATASKPLPAVPQQKTVRFAPPPPAWEFYRNAPTWDNTVNTQYQYQSKASQYPKTTYPSGYGYGPPPAVSPTNQGAYYTWRR